MYNLKHHIYIPTMDEIRELTGLDILIEEGNEQKANAKVLSLTLKAKTHLFKNKIQDTKNVLEYLIAFDDEYQQLWKTYVIAYIEAFFYADDFVWGNAPFPNTVEETIVGTKLNVKYFDYKDIMTVNNSDKEW